MCACPRCFTTTQGSCTFSPVALPKHVDVAIAADAAGQAVNLSRSAGECCTGNLQSASSESEKKRQAISESKDGPV